MLRGLDDAADVWMPRELARHACKRLKAVWFPPQWIPTFKKTASSPFQWTIAGGDSHASTWKCSQGQLSKQEDRKCLESTGRRKRVCSLTLCHRRNNTAGVSHTNFPFPLTQRWSEIPHYHHDSGEPFLWTSLGSLSFVSGILIGLPSGSRRSVRCPSFVPWPAAKCLHGLRWRISHRHFKWTRVQVTHLFQTCQNQFPSKVRGESYPTISWRWVKCILENSCE